MLIAHDSGRPVHVHKINARNRDVRRALREHANMPEWITGVRTSHIWGVRLDLTESAS